MVDGGMISVSHDPAYFRERQAGVFSDQKYCDVSCFDQGFFLDDPVKSSRSMPTVVATVSKIRPGPTGTVLLVDTNCCRCMVAKAKEGSVL